MKTAQQSWKRLYRSSASPERLGKIGCRIAV